MDNNITFKESFLSSGKDLKISDKVIVKHPTYGEILDIDDKWDGFHSEELYYEMLMIFITDPYMEMVWLDDQKIDYESIDAYDLFVMKFKNLIELYNEALMKCKSDEERNQIINIMNNDVLHRAFKFFLNQDDIALCLLEESEPFIIGRSDQEFQIDRMTFNYISKFLLAINGIDFKDRIKPANKFAKQVLIEDERSKLKKLKRKQSEKNSGVLGNHVSALCWGGNGGVTVFNKRDLHIYDIVDGINRTHKTFNFNHIMTGIYSGNINHDKLNMDEVSWMR